MPFRQVFEVILGSDEDITMDEIERILGALIESRFPLLSVQFVTEESDRVDGESWTPLYPQFPHMRPTPIQSHTHHPMPGGDSSGA